MKPCFSQILCLKFAGKAKISSQADDIIVFMDSYWDISSAKGFVILSNASEFLLFFFFKKKKHFRNAL